MSAYSILFPILLLGCLPCSHWFVGAVFIHPAIKVSYIFKCFNAVESCIFLKFSFIIVASCYMKAGMILCIDLYPIALLVSLITSHGFSVSSYRFST